MAKKKKPRNKPRNKKLKVKTKFIDLMKKFLILSISAIILSACSSNVKGSWSCPVLEGGKGNCASISEADNAKSSDNDSATLPSALPEGYTQKQQKIEITLFAPKLKDLEKIANENKLKSQSKISQTTQGGSFESTTNITNQSISIPQTSNPQNKLRTEEKVGKVWFAPFIDADGNQHSESTIYIVDEKPKWISQR